MYWHTITREFVRYDASAAAADRTVRVVANRPTRVRGSRQLSIHANQRFTILQSGPNSFDTELIGYDFAVDDATTGHEIIAFHLHPGPVSSPHIHLGAGSGALIPELQTAHLPGGIVQLAAFARFLITDFGVPPLRDDWEQLLATAR